METITKEEVLGHAVTSLSYCILSLLMYHMAQFTKDNFYSLQGL